MIPSAVESDECMIDWALLAGGRCPDKPWRVAIAGFSPRENQAFLLSDADWRDLNIQMPITPLCRYGDGNGLQFERLQDQSGGSHDGLLLIAHDRIDHVRVCFASTPNVYLVLRHTAQREHLQDEKAFNKLFLPLVVPMHDEQLVYLDSRIITDPKGAATNWEMIQTDTPHQAPSYPRSADYWINRITTAIAADAANVRGQRPRLSVIVPTYNYGKFLQQCVQSVLDQGIDDIEVLVLDNASSDCTQQVMAAYTNEPRVRYMRNRYNYGAGHNWRNGLAIARGRYFTFLSADDFLNPGYLQRLLPVLETHPHVKVGYTRIRWVDEQSQPVAQIAHPGYRSADYVGERNEVADLLTHDCYMTPSAVIYDRQAFRATWRPANTNGAGDWQMVVQMAEQYPDFAFVHAEGTSYRWHGAQDSNRFYASTAPLEDHLTIVEGVLERGMGPRLRHREHDVADHIARRLALYPTERDSALGQRARALIERLQALAEDNAAPLISVIVTTWNRPQLLIDALASLQAQTYRDFEVVLVNDCGEGVEHLLADQDFHIDYLRLGRNGGPAAARNAAHRLARGRYVVYLDDDDLFLPCHLQVLADAIAQHPSTVIYTDALFITERIEGGTRQQLSEERRYLHDCYSHERLSVDNYIPVNTFAWPRALATEIGGFDEHLQGLEDWDFLLRLAARLPFHHVRQQTVHVRMRADGDERRSVQAFAHYPALYRKLYARHSDLGAEIVRTGRAERLKQLGIHLAQTPSAVIDNWRAVRVPTAAQYTLCEQRMRVFGAPPRLCIVLRSPEGDVAAIQRSIASLGGNDGLPEGLKIIVLTGNTTQAMCAAVANTQVKVIGSAGESLDSLADKLLTDATFEWLLLANGGDEFCAGGLLQLRLRLAEQPQLRALFADGWCRNDDGTLAPMLRPDLNLDLLLGNPSMLASHWVFQREAARAAGGFDPIAGDAAELDLILRLINADGFVGIEHLPEPLLTATLRQNGSPSQHQAILNHLHARGYIDATVAAIDDGLYRINFCHSQQPTVSVLLVVSEDTTLAALERCVVSILEKTRYANYQLLLVDNGAADELRQWMQQVESLAADRVRAFAFDPPLTHAAARNLAATQANGEFLLFLRPEVVALQPHWLDELLNHGLRPEVGVVGAKTASGDGKLTHAGLVPGLFCSGGHAFAGMAMDASGYMNRLQVAQQYSAVADSCLLIGAELFAELEGFDHSTFADEGADVDLCLRARARGYLTVWTPHALLLHSTEQTGTTEATADALLERWLPALAHDPAYNPSLRLDVAGGFRLGESDFSWKPLPWRPLPRLLAQPADPWGSGQYRVIQPFEALKLEGHVEGALYSTLLDPVEQARIDPDVVILQRRVSEDDLHKIQRGARFSRALKVYELDDYLPNLPPKSAHREHMPRDVLRSLRKAMSLVDRFVVSTPAMAEAFAGMHPDIRIARNRLPVSWWKHLPAVRRDDNWRPRVGWAGGLGHTGDLEMIADVVSELAQDVDWVFFGMCPDRLRPYVAEFHPGVDIALYPRALAQLQLDLAIAPLEENRFNECKSNLRLLEYGACAVPVVCSDVGPYRDPSLPVTRVRNRHREWVGAIREHLADAGARHQAGDALKAVVHRDWMLEGAGLDEWRAAWLP